MKKEEKLKYYVEKMIEIQNYGDEEAGHSWADDELCNLLVSLGYEEVVKEYEKIEKWYA